MVKRGYTLIPDEIAERTDLAPSHKLIIGVVGRLQGDSASCYPSFEYLAKASGMSRRQVVRIVGDLRRRKEMTVLRHPFQSNSYAVPWATSRGLRKKWAIQKQAERAQTA